MLRGVGRDRRVGQPQQLVRTGRRGVGGDGSQRASTRRDDTKRGCARPPKSAPRSARASSTGPRRRSRPGFTQANLVVLPGGGRVRLPALLRRQPAAVPGAGSARAGRRSSRSRPPRARICAPISPATASTATARSGRRAGSGVDGATDLVAFLIGCSFTFERALLAARPAGPPHRAGRERPDVPHRRRVPAGGPLLRPAGRLDAPDDAGRRRSARPQITVPLPVRPRRPGARRRSVGARDHVLGAPHYGDPVEIRDGEVPVFWACGVTPQAVAPRAGPSS